MRTISSAFQNHLMQELTTLAQLVKITRLDGEVIGLTTHDTDISIDGVTYIADGAFSEGKLSDENDLKANDYEVTGLLDSGVIAESDIQAGLYDHARIDVYVCNWGDLSQGVIHLRRGWLGEIVTSGGGYKASLRGFHDLLSRRIGETYSPECRYHLGDGRCGLALSSWSYSGSATSVTDRRTFADAACAHDDGYFSGGKLSWTSGAMSGQSFEVCSYDADGCQFQLWLPASSDIQVGDTFTVTAGCDKRFSTCRKKFNNAVNYGGFPYLPGISKILQYPNGL